MKKILGLDLGVASIGWALINISNDIPTEILGMGSRIIPLSPDDANEFSTGNAITKNQKRTERRTQRKGYVRYQLRRKNLTDFLRKFNMSPTEELIKLDVLELWGLRAKAVNEQISLIELGRILYHLNQKRGYKSAKSDDVDDKKQRDYVANVTNRYKTIKVLGQTIGQYFYGQLLNDKHYRTKEQVFPRAAYVEEFETIWNFQANYYPAVLTEENKEIGRDEIIYYQRNLKSCKHLVSLCEFEMRPYKNKEGKTVYDGPKVAPRSSPIFQVCKNWESINNLVLKNRKGIPFEFTLEHKQALFNHLDNNEKLTTNDLYKILGISKSEGWWGGKAIGKGLQGNTTKMQISRALVGVADYRKHLHFNLKSIDTKLVDTETGEIVQQISPDFEKEPLYRLWQTIYSIHDKEELANVLRKNFGIEEPEVIDALYKIDFGKAGFGNKSAKAIRRILPYLQDGLMYSEACLAAGFRHSDSLTVAENEARVLLSRLPQIKKNELRQPIVEKILNQMINLGNAVIDQYGPIDEIRVELARELKQSREERNETSLFITANEVINSEIEKRLKEHNISITKKNIDKYKLISPIRKAIKKDGKVDLPKLKNAVVCNQCIYCGQSFSFVSAMNGEECDIDHIIPKTLLFDDSQTNKVLVHKKCNQKDKNNKTAFDFIRDKGDDELTSFLKRLEDWHEKGIISNAKRERLLASHEDYLVRKRKGVATKSDILLWENFINRQIKETQYISQKAIGILSKVCRNVWATSGVVTAELRNIWGWNSVLLNLQKPKYEELGMIENEKIKDWNKRNDHRHHAIDALIVACTKQGIIQRINTLNSDDVKDEMKIGIKEASQMFKEKKSLLEKYISSLRPFTTAQVEKEAEKILISFKSGKKAASPGKRIKYANGKKIVLQEGIIIPRGALHEEGVYGEIKSIFAPDGNKNEKPLLYLFENPKLIMKGYIRDLIKERLFKYNDDIEKAYSSIKIDPIYLNKKVKLDKATCYNHEIVKKYKMGVGSQGFLFTGKESYEIKSKTDKRTGIEEFIIEDKMQKALNGIVDNQVRNAVLERLNRGFEDGKSYKDDIKRALSNLKNLENNPIYLDKKKTIPIKTVRCFTGRTAVEPIRFNEKGEPIAFVNPGNNHHIALYKDIDGEIQELSVTFWHAVERKKFRVPTIIENPGKIWDDIQISKAELPESFLKNLPNPSWTFITSLQQNEMFIYGLSAYEIAEKIQEKDFKTLSYHLYRVQNIAPKQYFLRLHIETRDLRDSTSRALRLLVQASAKTIVENAVKIRIDYLGQITSVNNKPILNKI